MQPCLASRWSGFGFELLDVWRLKNQQNAGISGPILSGVAPCDCARAFKFARSADVLIRANTCVDGRDSPNSERCDELTKLHPATDSTKLTALGRLPPARERDGGTELPPNPSAPGAPRSGIADDCPDEVGG